MIWDEEKRVVGWYLCILFGSALWFDHSILESVRVDGIQVARGQEGYTGASTCLGRCGYCGSDLSLYGVYF